MALVLGGVVFAILAAARLPVPAAAEPFTYVAVFLAVVGMIGNLFGLTDWR